MEEKNIYVDASSLWASSQVFGNLQTNGLTGNEIVVHLRVSALESSLDQGCCKKIESTIILSTIILLQTSH